MSTSNSNTTPLRMTPNGGSGWGIIVDRDPHAGATLGRFLENRGMAVRVVSSVKEAETQFSIIEAENTEASPVGVAFIDGESGGPAELVGNLLKRHPWLAVVVLATYGNVPSAVAHLRAGAVDYLVRPLVDAELEITLDRALQHSTVRSENASLRGRLSSARVARRLIGHDPRMHRVYELVDAVAAGRSTVLMTGESGTGKSLIAHEIHARSPRHASPFVELSCGSIPETLLESELFGHVKGAFTGAHTDKVGRFLAADKGTIFLDEINSASPAMQLKLLRVIQERKFEPVGSSETVEVDVRVLLATNQPLEPLVAAGTFRQDLYYRINVVGIDVPPLRDRAADIPVLARAFLARQSAELGRQFVGFGEAAMQAMVAYAFPGNVRELQNVVERAAVICREPVIGVEYLPPHLTKPARVPSAADSESDWVPQTLEAAMREPERRIVLAALRANGWSRQKTAEQLGINRTTLYKKMRSLGLDAPDRLAG